MMWMILRNVAFLCSIGTLQCQTAFKSKEMCKNKRDVTVILDSRITDDKIKWSVWEEQQEYLEKFNYLIKTLNTELNREACLNLSLVKFSLNGFVRVNDLLDDRASLWRSKSIDNFNVDLSEFLHLYKNRSTRKRTLILLINNNLGDGLRDAIYRLQTENNFDVILVSPYVMFDSRPIRIPLRHQLAVVPFRYDLIFDQLVDIIKEPNFDRFKFDRNLPNFKEKRCLENVNIVMFLRGEIVENTNFKEMYIISPIYNYRGILTIKTVRDIESSYKFNERSNYGVDFGKVSFAQLQVVLNGAKRNIFLFVEDVSYISYAFDEESRITRLENLLYDNNQIVVKFFVKNRQVLCRERLCSSNKMTEDIFFRESNTGWHNMKNTKILDFILDVLVDAGC